MLFHGLNVVSCNVASDSKQTPLIGAYLTTSTMEHLPDLEEALTRFQDQYPIMLGDLNASIGKSHNPHSQ